MWYNRIHDAAGNSVESNASHIANINPYRYHSYYYDAEIAKYYLQSRYYDAVVGRFINGDESFLLLFKRLNESNLFRYCKNDSVNNIDLLGYVSYENEITPKDNVYSVVTKLKNSGVEIVCEYTISDGLISFDFKKNEYGDVLRRGWSKILVKAMYEAAKSINQSYLAGRTILDLHHELLLHWIVYTLDKFEIFGDRPKIADMGGIKEPGYDGNAGVFVGISVLLTRAMFSVSGLIGWIILFRNIVKYGRRIF